jgi:hypothetical protein
MTINPWDIPESSNNAARSPGKLPLDLAFRRSGATDSETTQSRPGIVPCYAVLPPFTSAVRVVASGTLACIGRHSGAGPTATLLSSFRGYLREPGPGYRRTRGSTPSVGASACAECRFSSPIFGTFYDPATGARVKNSNQDRGFRAKGFARAAVRGGADSRGARRAQALLDRPGR